MYFTEKGVRLSIEAEADLRVGTHNYFYYFPVHQALRSSTLGSCDYHSSVPRRCSDPQSGDRPGETKEH